MPFLDASNPLAAGNETPRYEQAIMTFGVTNTTLPGIGTLVQVKAPYTPPSTTLDWPTASAAPAILRGIKAATAGNFYGVGVCIGGATLGTAPVKGGTIMVCAMGYALVRFKATTTAGHVVIVSTSTAGNAKTAATATLGKTYGVVLKAVTISAGTALVPCFIEKV